MDPGVMDASPGPRLALSCERLGLRVPFARALDLARSHGFEAIDPAPQHLARLTSEERHALASEMHDLTWGADKLEVELRADEAAFRTSLANLDAHAAALAEVGCLRVGTYLPPASEELAYDAHLERIASRLREIADRFAAHGIRLGLEYIAAEPLRRRARYPFVHDLRGALEVVRAVDRSNVGVLLDSWHWHIAGEGAEDLLNLLGSTPIVAVDLNDAPLDLPREVLVEQRDLPGLTGRIDIGAFVAALRSLGYEGPARVEAYSRHVREGGAEATVARAARALRGVLGRSEPCTG